MKTISSRTNSLVKQIATLHSKKGRRQHQQFIAEGLRACTTLISAGHQLINLFVTDSRLKEVKSLAPESLITVVDDHVMEKLSSATTPNGILGQFSIPVSPNSFEGNGLVLAQITDPGNMGSLIRTAAALNVKSIVIIEGVDCWGPKVVQASAGTIGMVKIFNWNFDQLQAEKKNRILQTLVVDGGQKPAAIEDEWLLMIGSEAHGIPSEWVEASDQKITLPMPGDTESLNAAVAGSIALYMLTQH